MSTLRKSVIGKSSVGSAFQLAVDSIEILRENEVRISFDVLHKSENSWKVQRSLKELHFFSVCIAEFTNNFKFSLPTIASTQVNSQAISSDITSWINELCENAQNYQPQLSKFVDYESKGVLDCRDDGSMLRTFKLFSCRCGYLQSRITYAPHIIKRPSNNVNTIDFKRRFLVLSQDLRIYKSENHWKMSASAGGGGDCEDLIDLNCFFVCNHANLEGKNGLQQQQGLSRTGSGTGVSIEEGLMPPAGASAAGAKGVYEFSIHTDSCVISLRAASPEELQHWVLALEKLGDLF